MPAVQPRGRKSGHRRARHEDSGRISIGAIPAPMDGMIRPYDAVEGLTERVIRCAIEVHRVLGPGLLESPYRECLLRELVSTGLKVEASGSSRLSIRARSFQMP